MYYRITKNGNGKYRVEFSSELNDWKSFGVVYDCEADARINMKSRIEADRANELENTWTPIKS